MSGLTPISTKLSGPGGYTTTTPTLKGGAGELKPMGGGVSSKPKRNAVSPFSEGRRGRSVELKGPGKIIPAVGEPR